MSRVFSALDVLVSWHLENGAFFTRSAVGRARRGEGESGRGGAAGERDTRIPGIPQVTPGLRGGSA